MYRSTTRVVRTLSALIFCLLVSPLFADAQIVRDSSLGAMKNQPLVGPNYAITPDLGVIQGPNLFHSFSQFNLNTLPGGTIESATFSGPNTIGNILTRVSGTTTSNLNGAINSQIPGANLFFFNPNGIVFGPNASLNVSGSVAFSTANYIRFVDGAKFYASLSQTSTLTSAPVAAFGFLGPSAAPINIQGAALTVPDGQTLSVVGGDITMAGATLVAASGRINLASAASAGEVVFSTIPGTAPIDMQGFASQGQISILQGSGVDVSGVDFAPGRVTIRGGRVLVTDQSFVASDNSGAVDAPGVGIDISAADLVSLQNQAVVETVLIGAGRSGGIAIKTTDMKVTTGAFLFASTFGAGDAGPIAVEASGTIVIGTKGSPDNSIGLFSDTIGSGNAGSLTVSAPVVNLHGGRIRAFTGGTGNAGSIALNVNRLTLTDGARVDSGAIAGSAGHAGPITVSATEAVTISEAGSGFLSDTSAGGNGGTITVTTDRLAIDRGRISALTSGAGDGGRISVTVGQLALTNGAQLLVDARSGSTGRGGTITVTAGELISMTGQDSGGNVSGMFAATAGSKDGGQIVIDSPVVEVDGGAIQTGTAAAGSAGTVRINAARMSLTNGGQISSSAGAGSSGRAGHLTVIAQTLEVEGGSIQARRDGTGGGGTIDLNVDAIMLKAGGLLDGGASLGQAGDSGSINIARAHTLTITGTGNAGNPSGIFGDAGPNSLGGGSSIHISADILEMQGGRIQSPTRGAGSGGPIMIEVHQLTLQGGAEITSSTAGIAAGGPVTVTARDQIIVSGFRMEQDGTVNRSAISSDVLQGSTGAGGRLTISAPLIRLLDNGKIEAATAGAGPGGEIAIDTGQLIVSGGAEISVGTLGAGAAGKLTVNAAQSVSISGNSALGISGLFATAAANSQGDAGAIVINTPSLNTNRGLIQAITGGAGRGGNLLVTADVVSLLGTGQISSSTFGPGAGGTVSVVANSSATFTGFRSGLFTNTTGTGSGGSISLKAGAILLTDGAVISAESIGSGNAGQVLIAANSTFQNTSSSVSTAAGLGLGGDVTITAGQTLVLNGAIVSAQSSGPGNAGDIVLGSGNTLQLINSKVVTRATVASGGNITLQAPYLIQLINSTVNSSVAGGVQTVGGNINIDPQFLILQNSQIIAQAFQGQGGNITINAGVFLADPSSVVDASSQLGVSGTVTVNSPIQNLSGTLAPLTQRYLSASRFLRERCAVRAKSSLFSSFLIRGRDGAPPAPGGVLLSPPARLPARTESRGDLLRPIDGRPSMTDAGRFDREIFARAGECR